MLSYFLYWYNYNEARDTMSMMMTPEFMLVHAQPVYQADLDKEFKENVEKYMPPEFRKLVENLTDHQQGTLNAILIIGKEKLLEQPPEYWSETIENMKNLPPPDPEIVILQKVLNDTETGRAALAPISSAPSPIQFSVVNDTGKGDMLDMIPFTKPGQIYIDIRSGSGDLDITNNHSDWIPLSWSGSILFDGGTDQKSIGGRGWDRFIMDCTPGTPFGVTAQKDTESGILEVSTYANEVDENGNKIPLALTEETLPYGQTEETGEAYGLISISDICPE